MSRSPHDHRTTQLTALALALCLAGAAISGLLVKRHADPGAATGILARFCGAVDGTRLSCDAALHGPFSEITVPFRGTRIPVAFLGLAYFSGLFTWFAVAGPPRPYGRRWHRLPRHLAFAGVAVSAGFTALMAGGWAPWCAWCGAVHAINLALAIAVATLTGREPGAPPLLPRDPEEAARLALTTRQALTTIAIAVALVGGLWMHRRALAARVAERERLLPYRQQVERLQRDPAFLLREFNSEPRHDIPLRPAEAAEPGAPGFLRLVVFTDFQCPACWCNAGRVHRQILPRYGGRLRLSIRHFPLTGIHPEAEAAARAAEAARLLGGEAAFEKMYGLLFRERDRLTQSGRALYAELAAAAGLDPAALLDAMDGDEVRAIIAADVDLGRRLGLTGTPAMFLDGRRVTGIVESDTFWQAAAATPGAPAPAPAQAALASDPPEVRR